MNNLNRNLSMAGVIVLSLFSFIFSNCPNGEDVCLSLDGSSLNYDTSINIAGFQFSHDGCATSAFGGDAEANGFMVTASGTAVIGFSLTGATIPAGSGTLVDLGSADCTESALTNFIFSDSAGLPLTSAWSEVASGCMDETACNYDADAEEDDGSCAYEVDCAGECGGSAMEDCAGECGGSAMEDCNGDCGGSAVEDCNGDCGGSAMEDCNGDCGGTAEEDVCGECGGTETDPTQCIQEGYSLDISTVNDEAGTIGIYMNNEGPVSGFQFVITGATLIDGGSAASGGSAEAAGFMLSTATSSGVVLGFSLTGASIPPSNGLLTTLSFDSLTESICMTDAILSDSDGVALDVYVGSCFEGFGCMDESACNYNQDAVIDDGSCAYEFDCFDECGGDAMEDCAGECDGSAVEDCFGECNGDAIVDCAGECNGDAVEDCAGECGGTAVDDVCGECGGTETNIENCFDSNELFIHSFIPTGETTGTLNIYMSNLEPVGGFQFRVTSTLDGFVLNTDQGSASGGSSENAGFSTSTSETGMVLGFSFTGSTIDYGYGLLTSVDVTLDSTTDMVGYIYLSDEVMSDGDGVEMDFGVQDYFSVGGAPDVPEAPTNLMAEVVEVTGVVLSWDASDYADFYTVFRNGSAIADVTTPDYFDHGLDYEATYEYKVNASNGAGESATSEAVSVTTGVEPFDPVAPSDLTAEAGDEQVTLTWSAPTSFPDAVDCVGTPFDPYDPIYSSYDCMVCGLEGCGDELGDACVDWLGDTFCDDGSFGFDFTCETFSCDCGDCGFECDDEFGFCGEGGGTTGGGTTGGGTAACEDCDFDFTNYGSECCDTAWDEFGIDCATLEANYNWDCSGCNCPGDGLMSEDGFGYIQSVEGSDYQHSSSYTPDSKSTGELGDYSDTQNSNTQTREELLNYKLFMSTSSGSGYEHVGTTSASTFSYTVMGLENGTQYFFVATAVYENFEAGGEELESPYSNEASATPLPFEAPVPEDLTAEPGDSEVHLSWEQVAVEAGPGDECEIAAGFMGVLDCQENCFDLNGYITWIGDGFCDDGEFGLYFTCEEFGCDCGDCEGIECDDPNGYCDGLFGNMPEPGTTKDPYIRDANQNQREEDFVGYNIYRSTASGGAYSLVTSLEGQYDSYTDSGLDNGTMYYYVVTSQFEETESAYSNEAGASPMDFVDIGLTGAGDDVYNSGDEFSIVVSLDNSTEVAGLQIVLQDIPESVTMVSVEGVGRIQDLANQGIGMMSSSDFDGKVTILWFDIMGNTVPAGSGDIFNVTYQVNDDAGGGPCEISLDTSEAGTALSDSAGNAFFYNGDSTTVNIAYDANLALMQTGDTTFDVILINAVDVAGVQMTITDSPDNYTFSSVVGTDRMPMPNFMVSGNENNGMVLLAFSMTGDVITPGNGAIMNVEVTSNTSGNFETELCFDNIVLSDGLAQPILSGSQCATFMNPYVDLDNDEVALPEEFSIGRAYPNPFNPSTTIEWSMKYAENHRIDVYNTNGQFLEVISEGYINPGYHQTTWNASSYSSGVYIVRFVVGSDLIGTQKIMLMK